VDDVIAMVGRLLGLEVGGVADALEPYELYVLLFAVLLHDAGNARTRKNHEKEPKAIIARMGSVAGVEPVERKLIASIAEAHGGRTKDGDKDTIRKVIQLDIENIGGLSVRSRLLAAALRLADELSENPQRADPQALIRPYQTPESVIHNLYCKT
jgi:exopolyphosphatase/pppGpp-phosphohydrolase